MSVELEEQRPKIKPIKKRKSDDTKSDFRFVRVPSNRKSILKKNWKDICDPIINQLKLQIRMNLAKGQIEIRKSPDTEIETALQKAYEFLKAFLSGFEVKDALAILRVDDIFIDSFMVTDVRKLPRGHLSRAIGRIVGKKGKTKFTIENATQTRIVVADQHIHLLGSFKNIRVAKATIVRLIVGSQPGKVYSQMQMVAARNKCRY
ncbi:pre-rRNA-processing protein pno1 [Bonamia ostreae]|uniref:Pre-rRNA-processing protein pno1 n=1 Tax=Bonamia ostreae TaxID=126728 RepID=A0ABV2AET3_9EUKA